MIQQEKIFLLIFSTLLSMGVFQVKIYAQTTRAQDLVPVDDAEYQRILEYYAYDGNTPSSPGFPAGPFLNGN